MARKRVIEPPSLKSWEDVNDALRQIAEATIALGDIQSEMQKQIVGAQKAAEQQSKPYNDRIAALEREVKEFVTEHRDEMGKAKSKTLTFGEVGFRISTSISLPRAKEKLEEIIRKLKARQMTDSRSTARTLSTPWGPPGSRRTSSAMTSTSPGSSRSRAGRKGGSRASCGST